MKSKMKELVGQGLAPAGKKIASLLLAIAILFSITAGIDLSAYAATTHTQQEAVNWANAQVGKSLDQDGVYGAQCVDLIRYYYIYLGASPVSGNGCDYATNALPSGWSRIKYYSGFTPQPGDVAVWTYASSAYGHVAIVTSANSSNMNVVEQNGSTHVTRSHSYNYSYGTFWGVIRPDFPSNVPSSGPLNIGDNFYAYIIKTVGWKHLENANGNLQICETLSNTDPKQIWHFIRQSDNSYKIINEYDNTCLDADIAGANVRTWSDTGSAEQRWFVYKNGSAYNIQVMSCNKVLDAVNYSDAAGTNIQLCDTSNNSAQLFSIYDYTNDGITYNKPNKPEKVSVNYSNTNKNVTVSWSESKVYSRYDERKYDIKIYKSNGSLLYSKTGLTDRSISLAVPDYGTYKVSITANNTKYYNYNSLSESYINIAEHKHTYNNNGTIIEAATCTSSGYKVYHCSGCNTMKTETIPATGHNYETATTKATTKKNGSIVKKCSNCGTSSKTTIYYPKTISLSKTSYVYNGKAQKPTVTVKDCKGKKIAASNYTVTYASGRKNVGIYKVTIKFKGNYSGTVKKTFTIKPKATTLSSVTAKSKGFTAKWKKQSTQTTGYQIQYSTSSKFANAKTVTVSKNSTTSKAVSKLNAKKKYYVRIRTYKIVGKTKIYSAWSKSKSVTTKK